jgi:ElaA protein
MSLPQPESGRYAMDWQWLAFTQLSPHDVYAVLQVRQDVFVLEQQCLYADIDGLDQSAHHLLGWQGHGGDRQLGAYLRCLRPGAKFPEMSLGRVLTTTACRGAGIGRELLLRGIACAEMEHPGQRIRIGAQRYLERFYSGLGFETVSDPYDDDGIVHVDMLR